jgi:hypothetical protein
MPAPVPRERPVESLPASWVGVAVGRADIAQAGRVGTVSLGHRWIQPDGCENPFHFLI